MSIPGPEVPIPSRVTRLANGRQLEPVWLNGLGGVTFRTSGRGPHVHIKCGPLNPESSMEVEATKLDWLLPRLQGTGLTVPRVVDHGQDETHEWLVTETLPYASVVSERWLPHPEIAIPAGARALRTLHDALDPTECPYDWSVGHRLAVARSAGTELPADLSRTQGCDQPVPGRQVVAHGDACLPNTLLDGDGRPRALVDLALLGVADVWADLAAALWSVEHNVGPGLRQTYLDAYGIELDQEALDFHLEFRRYA